MPALATFDWWRAKQTCGAFGYPYQDVSADGAARVPAEDLGAAGDEVAPVKIQQEARRALDTFDAKAELAKVEEGGVSGCERLPFNSPAPPVQADDLGQVEAEATAEDSQLEPRLDAQTAEVPPKLEEIAFPAFQRGELDVPVGGVPASPVYTRTSPVPDSQAEAPVDALVDTNQLPVANLADEEEMATLHRYVAPRGTTYTG